MQRIKTLKSRTIPGISAWLGIELCHCIFLCRESLMEANTPDTRLGGTRAGHTLGAICGTNRNTATSLDLRVSCVHVSLFRCLPAGEVVYTSILFLNIPKVRPTPRHPAPLELTSQRGAQLLQRFKTEIDEASSSNVLSASYFLCV